MDPSQTAWRPWHSTSTIKSMTSTVAGEAEPGAGDRARRWGTWDEFSNKRTAKWADSGRSRQGSPHWVQPVSPLLSFLQISSHWGLSLKAHVTPVIKLPREQCSRLPHVYLFNKLIKPLGESRLSSQPQLISRPSTNPFYPIHINAPAASGYGYGVGARGWGEELWDWAFPMVLMAPVLPPHQYLP